MLETLFKKRVWNVVGIETIKSNALYPNIPGDAKFSSL